MYVWIPKSETKNPLRLLLNYITYMGDLVNPGYDKNIGRKEFIKEEQFVMFLVRTDCMKTVNDSSLQEIHRTKNYLLL